MKAFAILVLLPLVTSLPTNPQNNTNEKREADPDHFIPPPTYGHPLPPPPSYHPPKPSYGHSHGYEKPKHNCSVLDKEEYGEACTPVIQTDCVPIEIPILIIKDIDFTYNIEKTVCTETIETIPHEVCSYKYKDVTDFTLAKTFEVKFEEKTDFELVRRYHPAYGYDHKPYKHHGGYGGKKYSSFKWKFQSSDEVSKDTIYKTPVVTQIDVPVDVVYPKPVSSCVDKLIDLPVVQCANIAEEKTIQVPTTEQKVYEARKCTSRLVAPSCKKVKMTLPAQHCTEGPPYEIKPTYAPAPKPAYVPAPKPAYVPAPPKPAYVPVPPKPAYAPAPKPAYAPAPHAG